MLARVFLHAAALDDTLQPFNSDGAHYAKRRYPQIIRNVQITRAWGCQVKAAPAR